MGAVVSRKFGLGGKRWVFREVLATIPELARGGIYEVSAALPELTGLGVLRSCTSQPAVWEWLENEKVTDDTGVLQKKSWGLQRS